MHTLRLPAGSFLIACLAAFVMVGCGHSEDEWQQAQRDIAHLKADLDAANKRHADDDKKYADAQSQIDDLKAKLKGLGVDLSKSEEEKSKLKQAMSEYEARLKQLDDMKARFRDLKARLDKLTSVGLKVAIRNNRMVIQLPGDILFDSGKDSLKGEGKKVLKQVADVISGDSTLSTLPHSRSPGTPTRNPTAGSSSTTGVLARCAPARSSRSWWHPTRASTRRAFRRAVA